MITTAAHRKFISDQLAEYQQGFTNAKTLASATHNILCYLCLLALEADPYRHPPLERPTADAVLLIEEIMVFIRWPRMPEIWAEQLIAKNFRVGDYPAFDITTNPNVLCSANVMRGAICLRDLKAVEAEED